MELASIFRLEQWLRHQDCEYLSQDIRAKWLHRLARRIGDRSLTVDAARGRRWFKLPPLLFDASRIVWHAGKREFAATIALQVLMGAGVAGQLLLGKAILSAALSAFSAQVTFAQAVPEFAALLAVSIGVTFASTAQSELGGFSASW